MNYPVVLLEKLLKVLNPILDEELVFKGFVRKEIDEK